MAFKIFLGDISSTHCFYGMHMYDDRDFLKRIQKGLTIVGFSFFFLTYSQMSSLLGFTWIFGFLAAFVDVEALLYLFIVLNSLQGVYIFIAFICNKRVFRLWRDRRPSSCSNSSSRGPQRARPYTVNSGAQKSLSFHISSVAGPKTSSV